MPLQGHFQYNFQSLDGTKPSTSSATGKNGAGGIGGYQYTTLDGLAVQSNAGGYHAGNKTEDDVFSNLTVSNHKPYTTVQQLQ